MIPEILSLSTPVEVVTDSGETDMQSGPHNYPDAK